MNADVEKYRGLIREIMDRNGLRPEVAEQVTDCMIMTDRFGIWSHGTVILPKYMKKLKAGGFRGDAEPETVDEGPSWARLDGKNGFGMYNGRKAVDIALEKAKDAGMAFVSVDAGSRRGDVGWNVVEGRRFFVLDFGLRTFDFAVCVASTGFEVAAFDVGERL